jgi:trimethylamine:corrinoid methyltransferase-like protein
MNGDTYKIGGGRQLQAAIVVDPFIADYPDGAMRKPRLNDVIRNTRIIQNHPDVCMTSLMDYPVEDVKGPSSRYRAMEAHLLNHTKSYAIYATSYESFVGWMEIGKILTRGRPLKGSGLFSSAIAVLSPLKLTGMNCDILLECVKHGFPVIPTVCPMAGSTSPYTFAGTLVQGIAECLVVACAAQVMNVGHPFLFHLGTSVTDLSTGRDLYYTIDKVLFKSASVEFAKRLGLPSAAETGGAMNCRYDMQSGAEGILFALSAVMSGADVLSGAGSCLNANGLSSEHILTFHEFIRAAQFLKKGFSLSDMERSINSIKEQGCGGNFLMDEITIERLRDSEFFPAFLFDESGETGGGKSMLCRAHEEADRIYEGFSSPVPKDIADALRAHFGKICKDM